MQEKKSSAAAVLLIFFVLAVAFSLALAFGPREREGLEVVRARAEARITARADARDAKIAKLLRRQVHSNH